MSKSHLSYVLPANAVVLPLDQAMAACDPKASYHPFVWVEGEVSDVNRAKSGHTYFLLSQGTTQIPAVLWERVARGITVRLQDGLAVAIYGWVQPHPQRAHLELDVRDIVIRSPLGPRGLAVQDLQSRLLAEGVLDRSRKRPLPEQPSCIGIVTSPAGDVIHDIERILQRRAPGIRTKLAPARVSGEGAAGEIAAALGTLSRSGEVNVIILARGGGSASDLAAFNSEVVARAIADSQVPVISAIGHEPDVTIADLVADVRCATPSEAAELAAPDMRAESRPSKSAHGGGSTELQLQLGAASVTIRLPASAAETLRVEQS